VTADEAHSPLRVIVADDQAAVREGLATLIDLLPGVEVVGAASDGEQALSLVRQLEPDVVLMDLRMPGMGGMEATRRIQAEHPGTKVVILTTYADDVSVIEALQAGALGYLTKDTGRDDIARALHSAAAGQAVLDPAAHSYLLTATTGQAGDARRAAGPGAPPGPAPGPAGNSPLAGLTPREAEVLALIAAGLPNNAIAERLFISESTVKSHINHLFAKIGAADRAQAVGIAYQHGYTARLDEK
jgi:DNA-binding NarL/FixJ family response regulator